MEVSRHMLSRSVGWCINKLMLLQQQRFEGCGICDPMGNSWLDIFLEGTNQPDRLTAPFTFDVFDTSKAYCVEYMCYICFIAFKIWRSLNLEVVHTALLGFVYRFRRKRKFRGLVQNIFVEYLRRISMFRISVQNIYVHMFISMQSIYVYTCVEY